MKQINCLRGNIGDNEISIINNFLNYELRSNKIIYPHNENVHLKILIPCVAAGAIIGKGGEAIAVIQKESGAKVKISKSYDFYPGTTERICLIMGTVAAITNVHDYIIEKIHEKPEQMTRPVNDNKVAIERHKQVKILVPNSTAGMIIGKSGCYIKEIKEKSGAFVQISQKSKEINLPERCVTIAGDMDQNRIAVSMILGKIEEDPHSGSCPSISYVDIIGPVASAYPTGSPYAMISNSFNNPTSSLLASTNSACSSNPESSSSQFSSTMTTASPTVMTSQGTTLLNNDDINYYEESSDFLPYHPLSSMEFIRNILRMSGFSEIGIHSISTSIDTICRYGLSHICSTNTKPISKGHQNNISLYDSLPLYGSHNGEENSSTTPLEFLISSYLSCSSTKINDICSNSDTNADLIFRDLKVTKEKLLSLGPVEGALIQKIIKKTNTEIKIESDDSSPNENQSTIHIFGVDLEDVLDAIGMLIYTSTDSRKNEI